MAHGIQELPWADFRIGSDMAFMSSIQQSSRVD